MLAEALEALGASATLSPAPERQASLDAGACFASPAGGEVILRDRKVIGSAQVTQGSAFLQHGSILIDDGQDVVSGVTRGTPPPSLAGPLSTILDRGVTFDEVADAICAAAGRWPGSWSHWENDQTVERLAAGHRARFESEDWTWRR
jgi:lipoate-protein ligase A